MHMFFAAGFAALRELSSKWALAKSLGLAETDDDDDSSHDGTVARKRRRRRVARPRHKVLTRGLRSFSPLPAFLITSLSRACWHPCCFVAVRKIWRMTSAGSDVIGWSNSAASRCRTGTHRPPVLQVFICCSPDLPCFLFFCCNWAGINQTQRVSHRQSNGQMAPYCFDQPRLGSTVLWS